MARALWTGAISFGLVNVPVRLYSATSAKEVRFHMLHAKDDGRIQMKRTCSVDGAEVPFEEIVKGYELSRGQYVRVDPDELAKFLPKRTHTIEIEDFVELAQIDPVYYETSYHVVPDKGAGRAYTLLRDAMAAAGKVAVARMVMRTKESLCALRPAGDRLMLSTMLFADEVVGADELELPGPEQAAKPRELEMAEKLIASLSGHFQPEKYKDEYREQVLALIQKKAEGQELVASPERAPARVVNLADALEASLAQARQRSARPKTEREERTERRAPAEHRPSPKKAAASRRRKS